MLSVRTNTDYSAHVIHGEYRPHIDGIRALAVLPVVAFHILAALCPGGFAGVDVFFVISGYLITGGILRDLAQDRFTIRGFYHRRIRRILPAYAAVMLIVFATGCALYHAHPLVDLADTAFMGTLFSSNLFFYFFHGDYFSPAAHANPLLHLWSLSVEEQFYLFIPLLCAILWKANRRWLVPVLGVVAVLSFAGAAATVTLLDRPDRAFYLIQFRAWELLAGSLLALWACAAPAVAPAGGAARRHGLLAILGLLLVLLPYVRFSAATPFPGAAALPSVVGTALLIRYGTGGWVSAMLSWRPLVLVGKISYSLYLWHWPVIVFWRYVACDQVGVPDELGMLAVSCLLGYLSWRFVEVPVRSSPAWSLRRSFAFAAASTALLLCLSVACIGGRGWPTWLHAEANRVSANDYPTRVGRMLKAAEARVLALFHRKADDTEAGRFGLSGDFQLGASGRPPDLLLAGDSHAGHLQYGLDAALAQHGRAGLAVNRSSLNVFSLRDANGQHVVSEIQRHPSVSRVLIATYWLGCNDRSDAGAWASELEHFVRQVHGMGKQVFVASDVPRYDVRTGDLAARRRILAPRRVPDEWLVDGQSEAEYEHAQGAINRELEQICRRTGAVFVPLQRAVFQDGRYVAFDTDNGEPRSLYRDENHLSFRGSSRVVQSIWPQLYPEGPAPANP